eukprot:jgi/Botrbrau1/20125/Bobra.0173s0027.1
MDCSRPFVTMHLHIRPVKVCSLRVMRFALQDQSNACVHRVCHNRSVMLTTPLSAFITATHHSQSHLCVSPSLSSLSPSLSQN